MSDIARNEANQTFTVGGVQIKRPFKVTRLGHFGYYTDKINESLHFYTNLLGYLVSDPLEWGKRWPQFVGKMDTTGYFVRYNGDHHAFALFPREMWVNLIKVPDTQTVNQITWQVGSLAQVVTGEEWFREGGVKIDRSGRDMPGSNWHTYFFDPEGNRNELYYGMEQIGWENRTKPRAMHNTYRLDKAPTLPQPPEWVELDTAAEQGVDMHSGLRHKEAMPLDYVVGGVRMGRPFKIIGQGPVRLLCDDVQKQAEYYQHYLGFTITEEVVWQGHRCVYLRCNTDHHCLSLFPNSIRKDLPMQREQTQCFSFGIRLYDYQQLRDAIRFLEKHGVKILYLPPELSPGMEHTAFAVDPDGHLIQLYYYMEQIGWDGKPKPAHLRRKIDNHAWPESVEAQSDTFGGESFLGPWA